MSIDLNFLRFCRTLAVAATLVCTGAGQHALAEPLPGATARTEHATLKLTAERVTVIPGDSFRVALTLTSIPHWHTYWKNPGDTGLPTRVRWTLPQGVSAGEIEWPLPRRLPTPPLMSFGYEGSAPLLVPIRVAAAFHGPLTLQANVRWLVCAEQCVPESADVALSLGAGASGPSADAPAIGQALAGLAQTPRGWTLSARADAHWLLIDGSLPDRQAAPERLWLFPDRKSLIEPAAAQPYHRAGSSFQLAVPLLPVRSATGTSSATAAPAGPTGIGITDGEMLAGVLVSDAAAGSASGWNLAVPVTHADAVVVPVDNAPASVNVTAAALPAGTGSGSGSGLSGLLAALGFAFIGGLLLNLMPCVLPVLSLKVFALLGEAEAPRARLALHGAVFLGGVLVSFWVLASLLLVLKAAGASVGWGFQLQSPGFVVALAALFTGLALNFAGVFEIGLGVQGVAGDFEQRAGQRGAGVLASFSSGVLTTLVATPCTAPFLGAGIGFTIERPAFEAFLVFTAMGLGVGMPVTLLAVFPHWLRRVPRPGPWMQTLKQLFAFPMFATVAWLVWVLGHQRGVDAIGLLLVGLTLVAFAAWLWGRSQGAVGGAGWLGAARTQALVAAVALLAGLAIAWPSSPSGRLATALGAAGAAAQASSPAESTIEWEPYSDQRLAELRRQGRPVFVDFTAAWCLSCQVNKRTSLKTELVRERMHALDVVPLEADWTNANPEITAALGRLQRNAVPVYAVYPKDGSAPRLLPEVLTPQLVLEALREAAGR